MPAGYRESFVPADGLRVGHMEAEEGWRSFICTAKRFPRCPSLIREPLVPGE